MNNGEELLTLVINAHGGLKRWNELKEVNIHANAGGLTWAYKGHPDVLSDVHYHALLHQQYANYYSLFASNQRSVFEPRRVAIETADGQLIDELRDPATSFVGHTRETQWSKLQLIYFSSYAMWSYLTMPFNFTLPGVSVREIEPWNEGTETWRRLAVTFPASLETHNEQQVFYFGEDGLLRRHDYDAVVLGGVPAAHYSYDYKAFSGIMIPTKRRVYSRNEDNSFNAAPLFVSIDILEAEFK